MTRQKMGNRTRTMARIQPNNTNDKVLELVNLEIILVLHITSVHDVK